MNVSKIVLFLLVIINGGFQIRKPASQPATCIAGEFRFGDLVIPYPATVGQVAKSYNMKFWGGGTFMKDTTLFRQRGKPTINFLLKHAKFQIELDNNPRERPEDNYDESILEYRFGVPEKAYSFDTLRNMIEHETGKTFRAFPATSFSAPSSPWLRDLKGRTVNVYILRISECMTVTLLNPLLSIPEGIPGIKGPPFTSVTFILYKSDAEVEQMYMEQDFSVPAKKN